MPMRGRYLGLKTFGRSRLPPHDSGEPLHTFEVTDPPPLHPGSVTMHLEQCVGDGTEFHEGDEVELVLRRSQDSSKAELDPKPSNLNERSTP